MPRRGHPSQRSAMSVLFVCRSNLCRSPLAQGLLVDAVSRVPLRTRWRITSAGTDAEPGASMVDECARVLASTKFRPGSFQSRALTPHAISQADAVVTMTRGQAESVLRLDPLALRKTVTLNELARCAERVPGAGLGGDGLRTLTGRTILERGPFRPDDLAEDDIVDPVGFGPRQFKLVVDHIGDRIQQVVGVIKE